MMWGLVGVVSIVVAGAAVVSFARRTWESRCGEPPVSAGVVQDDPVFQIEMDEALPDEMHGISGTGSECGALGSAESTAFRMWRSSTRTKESLLAEAATDVESLGVHLTTLVCRRNGSMSYRGSKQIDSGDTATIELTARPHEVGSELALRLYVRAGQGPDTGSSPASEPSAAGMQVDGDCPPELVGARS